MQHLTPQRVLCLVYKSISGDRIVSRELWPPCLLDFIFVIDFYISVMLENKFISNIVRTVDDPED